MTMCPTYSFLDRADARFNRGMDFKKDYAAIISYAWDIDMAIARYRENPTEETYNALLQYGLWDVTNEEGNKKRADLVHMLDHEYAEGNAAAEQILKSVSPLLVMENRPVDDWDSTDSEADH